MYVEPFAGGAQVFFAKEPSEVEVLSDLDPEIAHAFRFAKGITDETIERLRQKGLGSTIRRLAHVGKRLHNVSYAKYDAGGSRASGCGRVGGEVRVSQIHSIKRRILPSGKVSFDAERSGRGGHADRFWAIALACQKERGPAPTRGTEIGVRVIG